MATSVDQRSTGVQCGSILVYIQEINPRRSIGGKRSLVVKSWHTVKDIKQNLQNLLHVPMSKQRLFFHGRELESSNSSSTLTYSPAQVHDSSRCGTELRELKRYSQSLQDYGIVRDGEVIYFAIAGPEVALDGRGGDRAILRVYGLCGPPKRLLRSLKQVRRAMEMGINGPKLTMEGFGGTYFMHDTRKRPLACFKPGDEEAYAPCNPRGKGLVANWGKIGKETFQMRPGVRPGEGYLREVATYLLDRDGFAGVPATCVVEARHKAFHYEDGQHRLKLGSFQEFVKHDTVVEDLSSSLFSIQEVQKVALLDIRLLNSDRNGCNLLARRRPSRRSELHTAALSTTASFNNGVSQDSCPSTPHTPHSLHGNPFLSAYDFDYELIPIDHGYCLPESLCIDDSLNLCWFEWRQLKEPMTEACMSYIEAMDAERDAKMLKEQVGIREAALDNLRMTTMLLKLAAREGLTLYDVACIIVRARVDWASELEQVKETAEKLAQAVTRSIFTEHTSLTLTSNTAVEELLRGSSSFRPSSQSSPAVYVPNTAKDGPMPHRGTWSGEHSHDDRFVPSRGGMKKAKGTMQIKAPLAHDDEQEEEEEEYDSEGPKAHQRRFLGDLSPASPMGFWCESLNTMHERAATAAYLATCAAHQTNFPFPSPCHLAATSMPSIMATAQSPADANFVIESKKKSINGGEFISGRVSPVSVSAQAMKRPGLIETLSEPDAVKGVKGRKTSACTMSSCKTLTTLPGKEQAESDDEVFQGDKGGTGGEWTFQMDMEPQTSLTSSEEASLQGEENQQPISCASTARTTTATSLNSAHSSPLSTYFPNTPEANNRPPQFPTVPPSPLHYTNLLSPPSDPPPSYASFSSEPPKQPFSTDSSPNLTNHVPRQLSGSLTRAISSPDFKPSSSSSSALGDCGSPALASESGFGGELVGDELRRWRRSGGKGKKGGKGEDYRRLYWHYVHLLIRDLVRRKQKQKGWGLGRDQGEEHAFGCRPLLQERSRSAPKAAV